MTAPAHQTNKREVAPLELFFDLVFVLAVGQLTHHLVEYLDWRGAAETAILLIAVCSVWTFTTFEITLLDIERKVTRAITIAVMGLGLFMNAGIGHAFSDSPWLFVLPMVVALTGPAAGAAFTASTPPLRQHFRRVLVWLAASVPLWILGASFDDGTRLWMWGAAAVIDLVGTFTAHPVPGDRLKSESHPFDAAHMLERLRLFLIILLGETVLTIGRVIGDHYAEPLTMLTGLGGFVVLVCLWAIYFGRAEEEVVEHAESTSDPIRAVHLGLNAIYGVMAGLVMVAAGTEMVMSHPRDAAGVGGVLLLAGPMLYVAAQAAYFRSSVGTGWKPRVISSIVLAAAAVASFWLPGYGAMALLVAILLGIAIRLARR